MKEKFKKFWKEISVFGLVAVIFLALLVYHKIAFVEYSTITPTELTEKIKDKDSFVVVLGSSADSATVAYQEVMQKFVEDNRGDTLYFCDLVNEEDTKTYIREKLEIEDATIPQTIVYKKGKVKANKSGSLSYYRLVELYNKK